MSQQSLSYSTELTRPVNVASVPKRSPFRYPGGKTWLVPWIRRWMHSLPSYPSRIIEPFGGGGIVSLTVICEGFTSKAVIVELDEDIASVWQTMLGRDAEWLANRILDFPFSASSVEKMLEMKPKSMRDRAFQTILRNRVYHGGILAPGSGLIKNGENGNGLGSRWYPKTLYKRIMNIHSVRDRIEFVEGDGMDTIKDISQDKDTVLFIDPPYTAAGKKAGKRLYKYHELDHERLFALTNSYRGDFLMTYDISEEIAQIALSYGFDIEPIPMRNTHLREMRELLIGRDLSWARD
ncbi:DNA adenine methylase [bacterium]|nr:DNA adenine methylase [bacterium]